MLFKSQTLEENKARSSTIHHLENISGTNIKPWGTPQGLFECKKPISTLSADPESEE